MKVSQLTAMSAVVATRVRTTRVEVKTRASSPPRRSTATSTASMTTDQTMRWARSWVAGTASTSFQ